jgi:hypothetical protein
MVTTLLSAFLKDAVTAARAEAFFDLSRAKREKEIEKVLGVGYPRAIGGYLATISPEDFVADVQGLLPVITASHGVPGHLLEATKETELEDYRLDLPAAPAPSSSKSVDPALVPLSSEFLSDVRALLRDIVRDTVTERRSNGFIQAFAAALAAEGADAFDRGSAWSSTVSTEAGSAVERVLKTGRALEVSREIQHFLQEQVDIASPTIQSPLPLSVSDQVEMRATLRERYPGSFPLFEVEPSLGGGLRLFYKGELLDESWMTHIARVFAHLRAQH